MTLQGLPVTGQERFELKKLAASRHPDLFDLAYDYIARAGESRDVKLMANLKLDLAGYYYAILSDHQKAKSLCEEVLPEIETWQDGHLLANVNKRIGSYSYYLSDYSSAGQHYNKARQLLEELSDKTPEQEIELADIYYNLSVVYRTEQYNDYRVEMNNRALEIFECHNEWARMGRSYNLKGNILLDMDKHAQALDEYLRAVSFFEKTDYAGDTNISYSYNNIASCYTKLGSFEKALEYLQKSLTLRQNTGSPNEVGVTIMLRGMTFLAQGNTTPAEHDFLQAVKIFKQTSNKFDLAHTLLQLANVYKLKQDYKNSCTYLEEHLTVQNELNNEGRRRAIADALANLKLNRKKQKQNCFGSKTNKQNSLRKSFRQATTN